MTYLTDISLMKFKKGETIKLYVKPWGNMRTNTYDESFYIKLQERGIDYKFVTEEEYRQGCFEYAVWSIDKKLTVECKNNEKYQKSFNCIGNSCINISWITFRYNFSFAKVFKFSKYSKSCERFYL